MSTAPHYMFGGRLGTRLGDVTLRDGVVYDGLWCSFNDCRHDRTRVHGREASLKRDRIDEFSVNSQKKAAAHNRGAFDKKWRTSPFRSARAIRSS